MRRATILLTTLIISLTLSFAACDVTNSSDDNNSGTPDPVSPSEAKEGEWTLVKSTTDNTIHDVAVTSEGAYAVAEGGILLERTQTEWTKVVDGGVSGNGNDLLGLAVTDNGNRLWLVGSSGAVGEYDIQTGNLNDYSQPMDASNNFNDVSATNEADSANIYIAGDSGKIYYNFDAGEEGKWHSVTPGNGSAINAIGFDGKRLGHIVDANQSVQNTQDGSTWNKMGIADADVDFQGIDSDGTENVWVSGGNGMIFHWNGSEWSSKSISESTLVSIEVASDDQSGYSAGANADIVRFDGSSWTSEETPISENLNAIVLETSSTPAIAVGAGGTILEK